MGSIILSYAITFLLLNNIDSVYYKSDLLYGLSLKPVSGQYSFFDDYNEKVQVSALQDNTGIIYWYRRVKTPVCLTGECKLIDVGLYWYCTGDFLGLEVYGEHLTKTDHSIFSDGDYDKLISILSNDWSSLREYDFADLIDNDHEQMSNSTSNVTDGTSGATKKEIASEAITGAVYTTYTLWHLVHVGEKEQLERLTVDLINNSKELQYNLIMNHNKLYQYFLMEQIGLGELKVTDLLNNLIVEWFKSDIPKEKNLAVKALAKTDINSPKFQSKIVGVYQTLSVADKLRVLSVLNNINIISTDFYHVLSKDLNVKDEWFSIKILALLKKSQTHTEGVIKTARHLKESENIYIKNSAIDFLKVIER